MKNKILSILLVCMMVITSFASGCSQKDEEDNTSKAKREKVTNVFKTNWISLPENYFISSNDIVFSNDRIYMLGYEQIKNSADDEDQMRMVMVSCDMDGNDVQINDPPYENISKINVLSDGSMIFLLRFFDEEIWWSEYWLKKVDSSGNETLSVNMTDLISQLPGSGMYTFMGDISIAYVAVDAEDRIYLQSASAIIAVSPETGKILFNVTTGDVSQMMRVGERVAVQYRDNGEAVFKYIDPDDKKIGEKVFVPDKLNIENYIVYPAYGGNESGILYCYKTATGLFSVSEADIEEHEVLNWLNSDISPNQSGSIMFFNNDKIFYSGSDYFYSSKDITAVLTRIPEDEIIPKYVIELGYVNRSIGSLNNEIFHLVSMFNQENDTYRVKVIDYTQLSGGSYGEEIPLFINLQIAAGNIPDIFYLDSYFLTGKNYEDKGLFYDLYEYLDSDPEMGRDKFLKCIFPVGEADGKLYKLLTSFTVCTVAGKTENVRDIKGWSISNFLDIAENQPDGVRIIQKATRNDVYDSLIRNGLSEFIDSESGTCSFNGDLFLRTLNYLNTLPQSSDYQYNDEDLQKDLRENNILLRTASVSDFLRYKSIYVTFGTEDLTFVGFPSGGEKIEFEGAYAVSAKSEKEIRDGAWAFIKYVFARGYSTGAFLNKSFPSTYKAFNQFAEDEMKYYYLVKDNGISGSSVEFTQEQIAAKGGVPVRITQEDVDEVLAYLESIEKTPDGDAKIYEIIDEEMQYFFADAKSAQETANLIQSRVSIYISESH